MKKSHRVCDLSQEYRVIGCSSSIARTSQLLEYMANKRGVQGLMQDYLTIYHGLLKDMDNLIKDYPKELDEYKDYKVQIKVKKRKK